jgi:hypothetical protein
MKAHSNLEILTVYSGETTQNIETYIDDKGFITPRTALAAMQEVEQQTREEMYLNMQYYYEYCIFKGYVTPQEWIEKHKHF